jgi:hypothetical protein
MFDLYILTTAICRSELHSECLSSFANDLRSQGVKAHWLINIDPALGDQKKTYENFLNLTSKIGSTIIYQPTKPCFFTAANLLINECYSNIDKLSDNGYVFWLEDDKKHDISYNIQELIDSDYDYIGFHPNHLFEFSFHPSMWSKKFFIDQVYHPYSINETKQDPEQLLIDYHRNKRKEDHNHFKNVKRVHFNGIFNHVGREWNEKNNIKKWNKSKQDSSISYENIPQA